MGSNPISRTRAKGSPLGGPFALQLLEFEPGSVVNEAPVGLQSRTHGLRPASLKRPLRGLFQALSPLSEPAGECSNPISRNFTSLLKPALFNDIIKYSYKPNSDT